jgi:hypothetical protein
MLCQPDRQRHHPQGVISGGPRNGASEKSSAEVGWKQRKRESNRFGRTLVQRLAARTRSISFGTVHLQPAGSNMNLMISDSSEDLSMVAFW